MCEVGDALQSTLEEHFKRLGGLRADGGVVFALEHGLDPAALEQLRGVVAQTVAMPSERDRHWLIWVVHAAEVAYLFAGDEYWPRLRRVTPGWESSLRPWVRTLYQRFSEEFGGPRPTGAWAETFSIICWPITNAVLPTDLQRHLARALWTARLGLASHLDDVSALGKYIAATSWEGSDRFAQLKEQPLLLGQIARALLPTRDDSDSLLLQSTLHRIAADLEKHRSAAIWLRGARRTVDAHRVRPRGVSTRTEPPPEGAELGRARVAARLNKPQLLMRASGSDIGAADLWLALPNLSAVAATSDEIRVALGSSRCSVPASDRPVWPGRLLYDSQLLPLARWPEAGSPLLRLQGLATGLEAVLLDEWAAPALPAIFLRRADGTATCMTGRQVSTGNSYLIATGSRVADAPDVRTSFVGAHLSHWAIPKAWSRELAQALKAIGIGLVHTSDIWPAGAPPVHWDGTSVEWLSTDQPMLGLRPDHALRQVTLELDGHKPVSISDVPAGLPVYLVLADLPVGVHQATLREFPEQGTAVEKALWISVREPRISAGGSGPVRMWVEPHTRSLEELWDGDCSVVLAGPRAQAKLAVGLAERAGLPALGDWEGLVEVPMDGAQWRAVWQGSVTQGESIVRAYDHSGWCRVEVDTGRFGKYALEFERRLPVLRWRVSRSAESVGLRLTDDSDDELATHVTFASFKNPNRALERVEHGPYGDISADPQGGLYVAENGSNVAVIIAPVLTRILHGFDQLNANPEVSEIGRTESSLRGALHRLRLWCQAPLPADPLARQWRAQSVWALHHQVVGALCGRNWLRAEHRFLEGPGVNELEALRRQLVYPQGPRSPLVMKRLVAEVADVLRLPIERRLAAFTAAILGSSLPNQSPWQRIVDRHGPRSPEWAAEWFLRLATDPAVEAWSGPDTDDGIAIALAAPHVVEVARFLGLASDLISYSPGYPPLFDHWVWND